MDITKEDTPTEEYTVQGWVAGLLNRWLTRAGRKLCALSEPRLISAFGNQRSDGGLAMLKTFEATANVSPTGEMNLRMPPDIAPGKHRVIVLVEAKATGKKTKPKLKIDTEFFKKKTLDQILREQKVKPFKKSSIPNTLADPKLWEGFDEWLAEQRSEGRKKKRR